MNSGAVAIDLDSVSRSNPTAFLKAVFDGLNYDGFRFPTSGRDGCIGNFCISKALPVAIVDHVRRPTGNDKLALHLNFGCTPGGFGDGKLRLKITHFHLTARPLGGQRLIDTSGPSALTAKESIHINRNGDWGRKANILALCAKVDVEPEVLLASLKRFEGYTAAYMIAAARGLKAAITKAVSINAGETVIDWSGSDSTFL